MDRWLDRQAGIQIDRNTEIIHKYNRWYRTKMLTLPTIFKIAP